MAGAGGRQVPIPHSLTARADVSVAFGASSAKNAWLIDQPNGTTTPVVRWNGHEWKAWAIPPWALVWNESNIYRITTAFFSWRNVWLFSLGPGYHFGPGDRGTIARYNGRRWTGTSPPVILNQVSVLSRNDIWGFGAGGGRVTSKLSGYSLVNWNGHRWLTVRVPKAQLPGQTFLANPVALGPKDVWLDQDATGVTDALVHWNSRSWSQVAIPAQISHVTAMTQDGHPVPGVAQAAIQQGRFVGRVIANRVRGRKDGRPFRYRNKGNMAVVGKNFAILESGHLRSSGFVTWLVWAALHVLALPQLQNRFRVQTQWFWSYLSGQRSSRLISEGPRSSAS